MSARLRQKRHALDTASTPPISWHRTANTLPAHARHTTGTRSVQPQYTTNIRPVRHQHIATPLPAPPVHDQYSPSPTLLQPRHTSNAVRHSVHSPGTIPVHYRYAINPPTVHFQYFAVHSTQPTCARFLRSVVVPGVNNTRHAPRGHKAITSTHHQCTLPARMARTVRRHGAHTCAGASGSVSYFLPELS